MNTRNPAPGAPEITLIVEQNPYLPADDDDPEMHAIVTVEVSGASRRGGGLPARSAEVFVIDCSSSMREPRSKIESAREATAAAIGLLRDGTRFAVIEG